jgi:hypothetical protein
LDVVAAVAEEGDAITTEPRVDVVERTVGLVVWLVAAGPG